MELRNAAGTIIYKVGGLSGQIMTENGATFTAAPAVHTHVEGDVTSLVSDLAGKAAVTHTHVKVDITDFAHTHPQSDVTNLVSDLAGKAALAHTHAASDVTSGQFVMARLASGTPTGAKFIRDDGVLAAPSGGGSATVTAVTITAPYNSQEYSETIADASVTTTSKILAFVGQTSSNDENEPCMDSLAVRAACEVNGSLILTVSGESAFGGPVKLAYLIGA